MYPHNIKIDDVIKLFPLTYPISASSQSQLMIIFLNRKSYPKNHNRPFAAKNDKSENRLIKQKI